MNIVEHLGKHVSVILTRAPFKDWSMERTIEDDLEERIIHYVFDGHGMELRCDHYDIVCVIFLHASGRDDTADLFSEISFSLTREQVIGRLGRPSKSGDKFTDPILGEYGPWDRFTRPTFSIRIGYRPDNLEMDEITLMRSDVVP